MNERGTASVQSIMCHVLAKPPKGLLYFAIFGSQVRGDERPDSDLDTLFVVREAKQTCLMEISKAATGAIGGVENVTIIPHTPETVEELANIYGTVEYHVLREHDAKTLYRSAGYNIQLQTKIDYEYSAKRWLKNAKTHLFPKTELLPCWFHMGIDCLLRASLLHIKVKFPYTRDLRVLYNMLPADKRPPLDPSALESSADWHIHNSHEAKKMAKEAYDFVRECVQSQQPVLGTL